jgi:Ca-activated chloride channel family protein
MSGSSIDQARAALLLALSSLQPGDRFNVIGFGSSVDRLFAASVPYDDVTLDQARAAVQRWDADLGGTEILTPLRLVLEAPAAELPRRLLVLTDGEVANEQTCLDLVQSHADTTVFTIGVGYGASDYLVRGLARAGHGQAESVHPGERIEAALMRQMARLTTAGLLEPRIDWGGLEPDLVVPAQLPPLYPGSPLTVFARVPASGRSHGEPGARTTGAGSAWPVAVALTAAGPDGEVRLTAAADLAEAAPDDAAPRLFAREAIRDLEEGRAGAAGRGSRQRDRREARVKDAIVELATRYTLMSSHTSFVAVEQRDAETAADLPPAELRRIPVGLLKDWHGSERRFASASRGMPGPIRMAAHRAMPLHDAFLDDMGLQQCRSDAVPAPSYDRQRLCLDDSIPVDDAEPVAFVYLVSRQGADGSWPLDPTVFAPCGIPAERLEDVATAVRAAVGAGDEDAATALAVHILRLRFPDLEDQWRLAADKAEAWLVARGLRGGPSALLAAVEEALDGWWPAI